jgi:hypothetical protein
MGKGPRLIAVLSTVRGKVLGATPSGRTAQTKAADESTRMPFSARADVSGPGPRFRLAASPAPPPPTVFVPVIAPTIVVAAIVAAAAIAAAAVTTSARANVSLYNQTLLLFFHKAPPRCHDRTSNMNHVATDWVNFAEAYICL